MSRGTTRYHINMKMQQGIKLNTMGTEFEIYDTQDEKQTNKLGTLTVSAGGIRFRSAGHRRSYRIDWNELSEIMRVFGRLS